MQLESIPNAPRLELHESASTPDLLAAIEVYFRVLNHFEPDSGWSWEHPALVQWIGKYSDGKPLLLSDKQLLFIFTNLESKFIQWQIQRLNGSTDL